MNFNLSLHTSLNSRVRDDHLSTHCEELLSISVPKSTAILRLFGQLLTTRTREGCIANGLYAARSVSCAMHLLSSNVMKLDCLTF